MSSPFTLPGDLAWVDLAEGRRRAVLVELPELMMVAFSFPEGGIGAPHSHPHVQSSYVAEGRFEVTIGSTVREIGKGGSYIVPSGTTHGVVALEAGLLVDAFAPRREDFL